MASISFVDGVTKVPASWLNSVDVCVYVTTPANTASIAALSTALSTAFANLALPAGATTVGANDGLGGTKYTTVQGYIDYTEDSPKYYDRYDLRTGMDAVYGVGGWTQRTGVGVGSDIGPAIDYLSDLLVGRGTIHIPPGMWRMATPPTPNKLAGLYLEGDGSQASKIVYDSASGSPFTFNGNDGRTGGGLRGLGILLEDGKGTSNATAIVMTGTATDQADQMEFDDLYITTLGTSYWYTILNANGTARTSPQGIRVCSINNLQGFRAHNAGIVLFNVVQWTLTNVGLYAGTGLGNNIYIGGGGAALTNSIQVYINGLIVTELNVTNASRFQVTGGATTFATAVSATSGYVIGFGTTLSGVLGTNVTFIPR